MSSDDEEPRCDPKEMSDEMCKSAHSEAHYAKWQKGASRAKIEKMFSPWGTGEMVSVETPIRGGVCRKIHVKGEASSWVGRTICEAGAA